MKGAKKKYMKSSYICMGAFLLQIFLLSYNYVELFLFNLRRYC